ncbi:hypothetical protein [Amycolatopsis sp. NPDC004079]|uniref:hypothetical protein n=1 Tax=Amycolatopsis sp. NPDC004079 TaxID=3154549 RepID=UPI0033A27454
MPTILAKQGLPRPANDVWRSYVGEWGRSLRADNKPHTTRYNYELAVTQEPHHDNVAENPGRVPGSPRCGQPSPPRRSAAAE